jgi:hypothetical protein
VDTSVSPPTIGFDLSLAHTSDDAILQWLRRQVEEAEAFLQAQPNYGRISESIEALNGTDDSPAIPAATSRNALSTTRTNRVAKIAEDMAALMTDIRPFWDYQVANRRFEQHAANYGKLSTYWYQRRNIDLRWGDAIIYHTVAGTGYVYLYWDPAIEDLNCRGSIDPRNILPIRPGNYDSLESCLGVVVKEKVTTNYIWDNFGVEVAADSDGSAHTLMQRMAEGVADVVSPIFRDYRAQQQKTEPKLARVPTTVLYTCFLKDRRRNTSKDRGTAYHGNTMYMGQWKTEEYEEPDPTQFGPPDPVTGAPTIVYVKKSRRIPLNNWSYKVEVGEPIYPHRRMIIWTSNSAKPLYDGPSYYWCDEFPIHKLTLNPLPWSWFGRAPLWDLLGLHRSLNRLLRVVDDHAAQVAQPGVVLDKNNVSKAQAESFDTRRPGYKIWQNPLAGKGIQVQIPPPLDQGIWKHIDWILNEMGDLSGVTDLRRMMNLNQLPSNSTVESILNSMTPALRRRSRIMEAFTRSFARQLAYGFTQFYTLPMRCVILGPGAVTMDDFDYDPGTLIPAYVDSADYGPDGEPTQGALMRGPLPRYDRARSFLQGFVFKIAPGSLLSAAQIEQKLIYLQLARAGWMDIFTLLETLGIPNVGPLPDDVRTIVDRLQYQASLGLSMAANAAGRKATGQETPRITMKES